MEIQEQLAAIRHTTSEQVPPALLAQMEQAAADLVATRITERSLKVGDRAPHFTLPNQADQPIRSDDILSQGSMVLSFHRGSWCPYCLTELKGIETALPAIQALGAQVVALSPQVRRWGEAAEALPFEMLRDRGNQVARQFGLVFEIPMYLRPVYEQLGIRLPRDNEDESFELPIPATYVINPNGEIIYSFVDPDYSQRPDPVEIITCLRRTQAVNLNVMKSMTLDR